MYEYDFIETICENASRFSQRPAVSHKDQIVTYAELIASANEIAIAISAMQRGGRKLIVLNLPNSIRLIELILGCLIARACFALTLTKEGANAVMSAFPSAVFIDELSKIDLGEGGSLLATDLTGEDISKDPPQSAGLPIPDDEPVVIFNSSGTSGAQKSVVHAYASLNLLTRELSKKLRFDSSDRSLVCMPMLLPFCLISQVLPALHSGATLIVKDSYDAGAVLQSIVREEITRIYLHGRSFIGLVAQCNERVESQLRSCVAGGELCPAWINRAFEKRFGLNVIQSMGMAETLAHSLNTNEDMRKIGSAGVPLCAARIRIEDADGGVMPQGEIGEIVVETPLFMKSYSGTGWRASGNPFHTGDLGYVDDDGYLWFVGRKSSLDNIGLLCEVQRLNSELFGVDGILDVFVRSNDRSELVVFVCIAPGRSNEAVSNEILRLIGNHPVAIKFLATLPKLPTGKMDTGLLAQLANRAV